MKNTLVRDPEGVECVLGYRDPAFDGFPKQMRISDVALAVEFHIEVPQVESERQAYQRRNRNPQAHRCQPQQLSILAIKANHMPMVVTLGIFLLIRCVQAF
jgi:hypothetical protein